MRMVDVTCPICDAREMINADAASDYEVACRLCQSLIPTSMWLRSWDGQYPPAKPRKAYRVREIGFKNRDD